MLTYCTNRCTNVRYEKLPEHDQDTKGGFNWTRLICVASFTSIALLLMLCEYYSQAENRGLAEQEDQIKNCLPIYDILQENVMVFEEVDQKWKAFLPLLGAYAYSNSTVVTSEADGWYGQKVYCRYFDSNRTEIKPPVMSFAYPEYVVYCCSRPLAQYMSITGDSDEEVLQMIPVLNRTIDDPKFELSLCLAPLYGNESKWMLLAELIEHYKLQGVQHFYVYIKDIDDYSRKLIDDYTKNGELEATYFSGVQDREGKYWQLVGIADCLHRSRHHTRYSIFADLDERIMATWNNLSLAEYISKTMLEKTNFALIMFKTKTFLRTRVPPDVYKGVRTLNKHLPTLVFHNSSFTSYVATKCVVDSRRVLNMGVHGAAALFPGYKHAFLARNDAMLLHYRSVYGNEWQNWTAVPRLHKFQDSHYPMHLMDRLYRNVKERLDRVYLSS